MSENIDLPWPLCLGSFDEESCRSFLYEIGMRLVPSYPFSFGIEEVYGLILDEYGFDYTPDVTSLLQELLEDGQNAAGFGDDGDVWRSWRHGWRHRNDDPRNPFIPHFGRLVLRPSTTQHIRLLKSRNFVQQCQRGVEAILELEPVANNERWCSRPIVEQGHMSSNSPLLLSNQTGGRVTTIATGPSRSKSNKLLWRRRLRSLSRGEIVEGKRHSLRPFSTDIDHVTSCALQAHKPNWHDSTQLRGGEHGKDKLRNRNKCHPAIADDALDCVCPQSPTRVIEDQQSIYDVPPKEQDTSETDPAEACFSISDLKENQMKASDEHPRQLRDGSVSSAGTARSDALDTVVQVTVSSHSDGRLSSLSPEHNKRAAHRQARLIDGTIFTSRTRRSQTISQAHSGGALKADTGIKKASARLSWSPLKQRDSLRSNFTQELRQLFHRNKPVNSILNEHKHRSVPLSPKISNPRHLLVMSTSHNHPAQQSLTAKQLPVRSRFGLDGTTDQPTICTSSIDLNKPLPLSPDEIVRSMSSSSQLTHSQHSGNASNLASAASTASSISRTSSKKDFRGLARDILQPEMLGIHELPPICEVVDTDNKDMADPPKPLAPLASPESYSSIAYSNPFIEEKPSKSPTRPPPLDFSKVLPKYGLANANAPSTNLSPDSNTSPSKLRPSEIYSSSLPWSKSASFISENEIGHMARGRSKPESIPQTKVREQNLTPKTPTKRSRSPIKRFLGLTKSNSTNRLEDVSTIVAPSTNDNTKKDSLKKWGDRLRYGFLTPDQEQLRQEELIEIHNNDSSTSTPQNSSFPISLEPPIQAKIQSEIELIVTVTANRYLLREARTGRISAESVAKTKDLWEKMNRPQVVEFHYDQLTQHNLIMANLDSIKLYGDAAKDAIAINSTMRGWKIMAREMSIRTFCSPDSVIRKHLHDAHRVLELLGAPLVTFLAYEDMQLKTLTKITQRQKERLDRRSDSTGRNLSGSSTLNLAHRRNASEGSYNQQYYDSSDYPITALQMDTISLSSSPTPVSKTKVRKATGAGGAIMSLPTNFERSREAYSARYRYAKTGQNVQEI